MHGVVGCVVECQVVLGFGLVPVPVRIEVVGCFVDDFVVFDWHAGLFEVFYPFLAVGCEAVRVGQASGRIQSHTGG